MVWFGRFSSLVDSVVQVSGFSGFVNSMIWFGGFGALWFGDISSCSEFTKTRGEAGQESGNVWLPHKGLLNASLAFLTLFCLYISTIFQLSRDS